ncbi:PREDICTED: clathrin interactor EPSIN 2-like isoform X2 [Tarenaya hassleriana]|uniref:clathrin interactor EPSIN 2-like isoform X2 n=1 Tax=Tarenaya hassleriana TaxID=28532 RepID=UPI00053C0CB6|nr:PREDICTED: clathrin interactor EPSIN 2-like isoform X2 [Tarenaya hassleriana]
MKKVFGQTVRDIKREVNKKVLKVPGIEQKVLDATSNEPWGPHGSLLADIAQASRNYHEYQLIMGVIWKRLSDTGKNWRHVYKALTILEYMVSNGSERVIDEIREHAYQISTLADFQYIDSSGRDQGSNIRKKSQSLVALVNDKERLEEARQKATANRDKYRGSAAGGMYGPSGGYDDRYDYESRYGGRDEERSSYGGEREYGYRDDDRYSRDGDRHSRDSEDRYGRDGFEDDAYGGGKRSIDNQYGSRSRSSDRDRASEDDGQSSSRGNGARPDDHSQDQEGRRLERKFSEQNIGAPPSYEEAINESRSPVHSERDGGENPQTQMAASRAVSGAASPYTENSADKTPTGFGDESSPPTQEVEAFDEFDPRGPISASAPVDTFLAPASGPPTSAPPTSNNVEMDLLGSLSDVFAPNALAIVPGDSASVEINGQANSGPAPSFAVSQLSSSQPFDDPFGDSPFKAIPSADTDPTPQQCFANPFQPTPPNHTTEISHLAAPKSDTTDNFGFGDSFSAVANPNPGVSNMQPPSSSQAFSQEELTTSESELDILAGILPPSGPPASLPLQPGPPIPTSEFAPNGNMYQNFHPQVVSTAPNMPAQTPFGQGPHPYNMVSQPQNLTGGGILFNNGGAFMHQQGPATSEIPQYAPQPISGSYLPQPVPAPPSSSQTPYRTLSAPAGQLDGGNFMPQQLAPGPVAQHGDNAFGDIFTSTGPSSSLGTSSSLPDLAPSAGVLDIVPRPQVEKKFEPKSAIWADTLSRGLVNLNISGPKTNPLAEIGVDFDAINRKEKRMEKQTTTQQVTSTVTMGKAMGSGSGLGRAGASGMRPPLTPMVGPNMPMGGVAGGYGAMNHQPMGMGMGMGGGYGQGYPTQPQQWMGPGPGMPVGYNPMMGPGGYNPQHPYGGYQ